MNRDREESLQFIKAFKASASSNFDPELIHVETVEEAEKLDSPAYIVSAVPAFPPTTKEEKQARAVSQILFDKPEKGVILEM